MNQKVNQNKKVHSMNQKKALILKAITRKKQFKKIALKFNVSASYVSKCFKEAKQYGLITPRKNLRKKGKEQVNRILAVSRKPNTLKEKWRLHDLQYSWRVIWLKKLHQGKDYFNYMDLSGWQPKNLGKNKYYTRLFKGGLNIQLHTRKVVVRLPDIIRDTPEQCDEVADSIIFDLKPAMEKHWKFRLSPAAIRTKGEYARMHDHIAEEYIREKKKLVILDRKDGKKRLLVDFSKPESIGINIPEFEAPHKGHGPDDAQYVHDFWESVIHEKPPTPARLHRRQKRANEKIREIERYIEKLHKATIKQGEMTERLQETLMVFEESIKRWRK